MIFKKIVALVLIAVFQQTAIAVNIPPDLLREMKKHLTTAAAVATFIEMYQGDPDYARRAIKCYFLPQLFLNRYGSYLPGENTAPIVEILLAFGLAGKTLYNVVQRGNARDAARNGQQNPHSIA